MADELQPERARSKLATAAMLLGLTAVAAIVGLVFSMQQRPLNVALLPQVFSGGSTPAAPGPASAFGFSVADDPAIHRVLLFGGVDSYDETWLWDGSRWSRLAPRVSPPGRFQAAAAYNPDTGVVMLFGGRLATGKVINDTWAWSGASWRELNMGGAGAPSGEGALMAWDNAMSEMVLMTPATPAIGGETWAWRGSRWQQQTNGEPPPTPIAGEMAFDPSSHSLLFVSALSPPLGVGTTTWRFDESGWHRMPATPPQATAGLALDPSSGALLLCSDPTPDAFAQLWRWSGGAWKTVPRSSITFEQGVEVTDVDRRQFLVLGFDAPPSDLFPQPVRVWAWDGKSWHHPDSTGA